MPEAAAPARPGPAGPPTPRVVLVTGASSGIGRAVAHRLSSRGHTVFAGVRTPDNLEGGVLDPTHVLPLDVTSTASVQAAVESVVAESGRIDVLVNNAGYGQYGALEDVGDAEARAQFDTNVFGLAAVTRAVLPHMRAQRAGHVVTIGSVAGRVSTPFAGWYAASKHAVEALSDALRLEVAPFGIAVSVIEPGAIRTGFDGRALESLSTSASATYRERAAAFGSTVARAYAGAPGPDAVAAVVERAVESGRPRARYLVPRLSAGGLVLARRWLTDRQLDRLMASQLVRPRA